MNNITRHPFSQIPGYNNLSMLESLIPFVEPSLKLPLAFFLKITELQLIIRTLQNPEDITLYGLHNSNHTPSDLLGALTGLSPEIIDLFLSQGGSGSTLTNLFSSLSDLSANGFEHIFSSLNPSDSTNKTDAIDSLFAAYDAQQKVEELHPENNIM